MLTRSEYARHRKNKGLPGGSAPAVTYACQQGRITHAEGMIDPEVADREWAANTSPSLSRHGVKAGNARAEKAAQDVRGETPRPDAHDANKSRAAKDYYDAELARLRFEEKEGKLIPATVVSKVLYEAGRIIRVGHDDIVSQLAPDLASTTDISKVEAVLKRALDALDNMLADRIASLNTDLLQALEES